MVNVAFDPPKTLLAFAAFFRGCFTKRAYDSFTTYLSGLLMEHRRLSIESIAAKAPLAVYGRLQYFVSESKWSTEEVNTRRLAYLQSKRSLAATGDGMLIIDDSACPKPYARHTEAAEPQYAGCEKRVVRSHTFVGGVWANDSHYFPIDVKTYKPESCFTQGKEDPAFRSKIQLAQELIDYTISNNIRFRDVIFDSWYLGKDFLRFLDERDLTWISEAKGSQKVRYRHNWTRVDDLVNVIPPHKFARTVTLPTCDGKERMFRLASFDTRLKSRPGKLRCVVAVGKWDERDQRGVHVFLTNRLSLLQSLQERVIRLPSSGKPVTLGDALRLHRLLNDREAFKWTRKNGDLLKLIQLTDILAA